MKKIVAIIGSPRKGETYKVIQHFEAELSKHEPVEVEYIMLSQLALLDCTGCHNCIIKGENYCREHEKIHALQVKMQEADAVILASPVYNQHITALLKKFFDYFTYLWHRPAMFGIKFFGISSGGAMFGPVFKFMKMNVESWGGTWIGSLGVPHYEALTDAYKAKVDKDMAEKAVLFLNAVKVKELPRPTFSRLMWFNMWKMNAKVGKDEMICDFDHWSKSGWFDREYYYDTRIGLLQKLGVSAIGKIGGIFMHRMYKGY